MTRKPYIEHCPGCCGVHDVAPYAVRPAEPEGVKCWYLCPVCGYQWTTSWQSERTGEEWT